VTQIDGRQLINCNLRHNSSSQSSQEPFLPSLPGHNGFPKVGSGKQEVQGAWGTQGAVSH